MISILLIALLLCGLAVYREMTVVNEKLEQIKNDMLEDENEDNGGSER